MVAITPAAGFVGPLSAIMIGFVAGIVCFLAIMIKEKLGYDDSLDVVAVHGVGGLWGALATGLFDSVGAQGLFLREPQTACHTGVSGLNCHSLLFCGLFDYPPRAQEDDRLTRERGRRAPGAGPEPAR